MGILERILFHFESPEDGGGAPPPEAAAEAPSPEAAPPAPEAPAWEGVSQADWEGTQQFIAAAMPFLQNLAAREQQEQFAAQQSAQPQLDQLPDWDPFDENVVQQHFDQRVSQAVEQALGPYQGLLGHIAQDTSQREAEAALGQLHESVGEFDRDAALLIAAPMIDSGQDARQSLQVAAQYMHELEQRIREDERTKVQQGFQDLQGAGQGGAPGNSPGVPATELDTVPTGPDRYRVAMERAMARRSGGFPVG